MIRFTLSLIIMSLVYISPAQGADMAIDDYKNEVISLNRDIGTYYFIGDYILENIEDTENQKIGTVQDFLINNQGEVELLVSQLNDLSLGETILNLSYDDIGKNQNSFQVAHKAAEMEERLAFYLANIEVAAGTEGLVSARRLHGREILLPSGESIGEVERVITDKETQKIVGVLIKDLNTRPEYERFALPYPIGLSIKNTGLSNDLELAEDYVEVIQQFTAEGIPK